MVNPIKIYIEDYQIKAILILFGYHQAKPLSRLAETKVLCVDADQLSQLPNLPSTLLPIVQPSDLLYVVFTSGSTGLPKGALVTHQNFSSAIQHQQHSLGIVSTSRVYDFVSYAFDVAWSNVIQTLISGAFLCIPSESDRTGDIAKSIRDFRANYAHLMPTMVRTIDAEAVPGLRTMSLIGEPVSHAGHSHRQTEPDRSAKDVFTHPRLYDLATLMETSIAGRAIAGCNGNGALDIRDTQANGDSHAKSMLERPTTAFQTRCIEAALREDKKWWNYYLLSLPSHLPTSQIVNMCKVLWDQFDILRTIFILDQDRYLQKVPPEQQLSYSIEEHDGDIDQLTRHVCLEDFKEPAILGTCFTKFLIIATSAGERRLTLQLSHAQYDGMSLQYLLSYLSSALRGELRIDPPQFINFIDQSMMHIASSDHFWQSVLQDVPMTLVPAPQAPSTFSQVKAIPKVSFVKEVCFSVPHSYMTSATVFTAACACVIAEVTATSDVVFGRLITGRTVLEEALQEVVGPCVNFVPVRDNFHEGDISLKFAQQVVQEQYARSLPYQTTGLGNAETDPRMTQFGFTVHYQAVDDRPTISLNGSQSRVDFLELPEGYDMGEVEIMAVPSGASLNIRVTGGAPRAEIMRDVLHRLCTLLHPIANGQAKHTP
ncbi:nonribosomal peptide synthase [Penicillium malachiteum]|uniref:Nonribosomal peptide synthase n=1 Tax=Penicillium malachiteum TaxID=1324776 RepID=A0AAD6MSE7_9EURO|nr:nonribosomal peptide synthase [Penicillium malachiteum]